MVGANVARLRAERRWSLREVSERLTRGPGWIAFSVLRKVEDGERAATVDELTALANVFGVSPITLLMPLVPDDEGIQVSLTGTEPTEAVALLGWLQGRSPLDVEHQDDLFEVEAFRRRALPPWAW